ncbi:methylenetetrahydrofolate--tRNA-(uracil(54)-C(5))-methyltransferase (FADH(2)-oxidizing) TrmFO [Mesoterricola sediminis]|uniref:Methylenetetrahydrofolate--tRNA-(uracil-5-)-methyltransferase TrmFO n=1 Tax=Mesoterricola sediminis TaxID=2927980 RepID=A0AA48H031_9BACT|nr:methylenetetrahydrofolate--tRNA-(uracil(54)-C(5))-methyltransferase (FADH(2)-oxidizing) TrmFO [Mesoterricola sediminis]BDU77192.1 methylenetetrahydrofolate--tRNA-(uracil-5-)-methyltransferase TrmFO [Mesoterricola sediminis]
MDFDVVGAGLAGAEAAWQLANRGHQVRLREMRPGTRTPAHQTDKAAEMVCSNSFKSDDPFSATGILKAELERLGSLVLRCARDQRVPAGQSLAVDREAFSAAVTAELRSHPNIHWTEELVTRPEPGRPTLLATGPLTADPLAEWLTEAVGCGRLFFYDAIAPIVERDSIDFSIAFAASRYGKGGSDFYNCPLDKAEYERFLDALLAAPRAPLHDFDTPFFEACLPIEVMADRGRETLRHGPMKPVGLDDPRTGRWPWAVVQLRQDDLAGEHFNLVGFQTRLAWGAQQEVFRLIPGLQNAVFARLGSIHRNTYVDAPRVLDACLRLRAVPDVWVAGQVSGVEGYLESAACGLAAARFMDQRAQGREPAPLPRETVLGALLHYIASAPGRDFSPVNAMLGLLPEIPEGILDVRALKRSGGVKALKAGKGAYHRERALAALEAHIAEAGR